MLQLRVFGPTQTMADVADRLEEIPGSRHVIRTEDEGSGHAVVTADLVDDAVDAALARVSRPGVPTDDVALLRLDTIGTSQARRGLAGAVWLDLLSQAGVNARPLARYLVFMATAGVIAAFGVIYAETTLIVGAMAISPDRLPVTAAATALVLRRWRLACRAVGARRHPVQRSVGSAQGVGDRHVSGPAPARTQSSGKPCVYDQPVGSGGMTLTGTLSACMRLGRLWRCQWAWCSGGVQRRISSNAPCSASWPIVAAASAPQLTTATGWSPAARWTRSRASCSVQSGASGCRSGGTINVTSQPPRARDSICSSSRGVDSVRLATTSSRRGGASDIGACQQTPELPASSR